MSEETPTTQWGDIDASEDSTNFQSYLDLVTGLASAQAIKERSRRLLRPTTGDRILDVGCGNGGDVRALVDSVGGAGSVTGVDNSVTMVRDARDRTNAPAASFILADAHTLCFDTGTFDGVRTDRVLQHLADPQTAHKELVRVTQTGGRIAVTEPDWGTLVVTAPRIDSEATRRILDPKWACVRHGRVGRRLQSWMTDAGLTGIEIATDVLVFTELKTADNVLGLTSRVENTQLQASNGKIDPQRWYEAIERSDANDAFFASLTLITVAGTKS